MQINKQQFPNHKTSKMKSPKNQTAEILFCLLNSPKGSRLSFSDFYQKTSTINLGQRISDLRNLGLKVTCKRKEHKNKFGRTMSYGTWSIDGERELAKKIYEKINR